MNEKTAAFRCREIGNLIADFASMSREGHSQILLPLAWQFTELAKAIETEPQHQHRFESPTWTGECLEAGCPALNWRGRVYIPEVEE